MVFITSDSMKYPVVDLGKRLDVLDTYSNFKVTKEFRCNVKSPLVKLPIFQPIVLVESKIRQKPTMYTPQSNKKSSDNWSAKDENNVKIVKHTPKDPSPSKKPLTDRNRLFEDDENNTAGIFELSENFDDEVLSSPKKNEYESDSDSYDYDTVVDALRKIKQKAELNSSQDASFTDSNFLNRIFEDPEKLSEKVKQSINYKALEQLKKSIEENESSKNESSNTPLRNVPQPTRASNRRRISITNTRYGADFETPTTRTIRKKKVIKKNSGLSFDKEFQLKTLKLLEKVLLNNSDSDSEFDSSIKREFKKELAAGLKSEFKKKEKRSEEKVNDAIDKIDNELDALALFKESWISSDDLDPPNPIKSPVKPVKKKPANKSDARSFNSDYKVVQPKNIKKESGLKLDEIFKESYGRPKPKSKPKSKKKKRPSMSERTLNKKSKTFFEDFDKEPTKIITKRIKTQEKVEKPKIIPYVPLVEVGGLDPPMIEVKDVNLIKDFGHSRPNILGRSYNDPKLRAGGERRNSSDSDKYHDTLYHLLKKEEDEPKPVAKSDADHKVRNNNNNNNNLRSRDGRNWEKVRKQDFKRRKVDDEIEILEYENYVGEDHWTNRGRRHVMRNSSSSRYPDSDTGEDDRTHETALDRSLWDHTYAKDDRPNFNVNYITQSSLCDHNYLEPGAHKPAPFTPSIDSSSIEYSAPNSPLPDSEDTTNQSGSMSLLKRSQGAKGTSMTDDYDDEDSYVDPIGFTDDSDLDYEDKPKRSKPKYDYFKKMQKKLMRALEKSKGKGRKEKYALVKKFFSEEVFKRKAGKTHGFEHNVKERERRKELRNHFLNLADQCPDLPENASKIQILQNAEEQIRMLSRTSNHLLTDLGNLKSRQIMLKRRVQSLLDTWKVDRAKRNKLANF